MDTSNPLPPPQEAYISRDYELVSGATLPKGTKVEILGRSANAYTLQWRDGNNVATLVGAPLDLLRFSR